MDKTDGRIYDQTELAKIRKALAKRVPSEKGFSEFMPMQIPPTSSQLQRHPPRVGRNEPCPCGSGKKFKKCCLIQGGQPDAD